MIWVPANGRAKKAKPTVVGNLANISLGTAPPCITLSSGAVVVEPSVGVLKSVSHMEEDRSAMAKKDSCRMQNLCIACNKQFDVSYKMKYCPDCGATLKTISYVKVVLK